MRSFVLLLAVGASFAAPTHAGAQASTTPRTSSPKLWAMLSAGRGDLQVNCGICRRNDQSSWAADIAVGGWLKPRTIIGAELGAWRLGGDEATQRVMLVSAVSQFYPAERARVFVKLGVGVMGYRSTDGEQSLSARSLALQAGFGWDIKVQGRYVVAPQAALVQGFNGGLYLDDAKVTGASQVKLLRFGLGVGVGR
ncbi:MAG TPA: hypothetical protein VFZ21_20370 [Gemmatimonadaceae bacterium]|jgi:hypothetical protein|nr:hypothetical protein [Gemmatimonadaceae bacterium]